MKHIRSILYICACGLALAIPAVSQAQSGSVTGIVKDEQGGVIPGADVSLQGSDASYPFVTDRDGTFRFLSLEPGLYKLAASLAGFKTAQRDVIVAAGRNADAPLTLRIAAVTESVTVSAPAPILDAKATGTSTTFSRDELANVPTSRDPFALVRGVPGVLLDRVNIGGNETGQAPTVVSKGTRPQDTVWTLDGIVITDMAAAGLPPTYFNFDNFEEIHVSTAGQDIKQQTGGVGINLITRRGTNQFHGTARGYYADHNLEASNVPDELKLGAPTATFHQDNAYSDFPLHGLWKVADDRAINPNLFVSAKYAYYNTGNALTPEGGMDMQAGRSLTTGRSYGSFSESINRRPQQTANVDVHTFAHALGAIHDVEFGSGFRTTDSQTLTEWPGNGILAIENTPTDLRAQVFRQGNGINRANYFDLHVGDTITRGRATVNLGLRYDHQSGKALASTIAASKAFPNLVPGLTFAGYDSPFSWNTFSPRAGFTFALDESRRTIARTAYSRYAGQLSPTTIGSINPSAGVGFATYRWVDTNGDHFAQADEVLTAPGALTSGGGFSPTNPTAVTSANQLDANLKPPVTHSFVTGIDRELRAHFALQVNYSYTKTTDLFGNLSANITPRTGVTLADYSAGPVLTGTLPDGTAYSVPTYVANGAKVVAGGLGFLTTTVPGYSTDYHGLEIALLKRMSDRWMGRVAFSYNNAREHFALAEGRYDTNGNPTPTFAEPLVDGGQFAPVSSATSGSGSVFVNAKWQFNANALYVAPLGIETSANVFGRQGYPFPLFRSQALGGESLSVLVTPAIDYFRYDNVWDTDVRAARTFKVPSMSLRVIGDVFNVFNANTVLVRNNNILSTTFNQIGQNLSPRIFRVGVVVGF